MNVVAPCFFVMSLSRQVHVDLDFVVVRFNESGIGVQCLLLATTQTLPPLYGVKVVENLVVPEQRAEVHVHIESSMFV